MVAQAAGDNSEARRLIEQSVALQREVGDRWSLSWALNALSQVALTQLDLAEAERYAVEALKTATEAEYTTAALDVLATLAAVRAQQGMSAPALEMTLHILNHPASTQEAIGRAENLHAKLETQLTPQQRETIQQQLEGQSFESVVKEILDTGVMS